MTWLNDQLILPSTLTLIVSRGGSAPGFLLFKIKIHLTAVIIP